MGSGPHRHLSGIALNLLRNKRSVSVDLKSDEGRAIALRLATRCDVVVTNLRPKPLARLGLAYRDIAALNQEVVYCTATGFASTSPLADRPAYDDIIQSMSGLADAAQRTSGTPGIAPTILADKVCAQVIVNAVLAALLNRSRTGKGAEIEIAMLDAMRSFVLVEHGSAAISADVPGPPGYRRVLNLFRGPQRTADGWIHVMPYSSSAYRSIFEAAGRPDLAADSRVDEANLISEAPWLYERLHEVIRDEPTGYWLAFCLRHEIPVGEVADLEDIVSSLPVDHHPVAGAYHVVPPAGGQAEHFRVRRPAPLLGEHTEEVLMELGYTATEIDSLEDARRIRRTKPQQGR
jgi:crotonobetainyl-CoA:carnitine CoA-transferase CaiB-like acyl-CoA transferase